MREIKFRAWDKVYKHFHDGDIVNDYVLGEFIADKDYSVTQYTGLKDSKDTEIYEGDILQPSNNEKKFYVVVWKDGGFVRKYTFTRKYQGEEWEETTHLPLHHKSYKIVGNIYENPELLK